MKYIIIEAYSKTDFQHLVEVHLELGYKQFSELQVIKEKNAQGCESVTYRQPFIHEKNGISDKVIQLKIENDKAISS